MDWLVLKLDHMLPEGHGGPRAFAKEGSAAALTNGLLEDASAAVDNTTSCGSSVATTRRSPR